MKIGKSMISHGLRRAVPARFRPIGYLNHLTEQRTGRRVHTGPFAGMRYVAGSVGSCFIPKLLGIYERELADKVELICRRGSQSIIDIGAAEGYYAVGMALRNPEAQIVAFEMDDHGRRVLQEMAELNGVADRLGILGKCGPEDLARVLSGDLDPIVICDVEGDEARLLDLAAVPALRGATVLVEVHDFVRRGMAEELRSRFAPTHRVRADLATAAEPRRIPLAYFRHHAVAGFVS